MDRGAWWAAVHGVTKELDMTVTKQQQQSFICFHFLKTKSNSEKSLHILVAQDFSPDVVLIFVIRSDIANDRDGI